MRSLYAITVPTLVLLTAAASAQIGPQPYLQASDSPWSSLFNNEMFYLETFEDRLLNTPGVTASTGAVQRPASLTDSVDGDDGILDGFGRSGHSYISGNAAAGIRFTFGSAAYGDLPTHAGLVWTDGQVGSTVRFEAFDKDGASLGIINGSHADGNFAGGTGEDRFYGWTNASGIGSIFISNSGSGGIEIDHLQYGAVPEPATMTLFGLGFAALMARRLKKSS